MQTNANREEKNIVEVWDWADTGHTDNKFMKKYCRRLRRRRTQYRPYRHLWWRIYQFE